MQTHVIVVIAIVWVTNVLMHIYLWAPCFITVLGITRLQAVVPGLMTQEVQWERGVSLQQQTLTYDDILSK